MRGFTLLEMILYMGIYSLLLCSVIAISAEVATIGAVTQEKSYVAYEGSFLLAKISSDQNAANDFYVRDGILLFSQASSTIPLSSSGVSVSNLLFNSSTQSVSSSTTVSFTLSGLAENGKSYSQDFTEKLYSSL
jgi:competence protein ComGC